MKTLIASDRSIIEAPASSALTLRIRGGQHHGRVLRLMPERCTIGSDPASTLRLHGTNVEPLLCTITRQPLQTVLRSFSPSVRFNERAVTQVILAAGDRLQFGPLELEILSLGEPAPAAAAERLENIAPLPADVPGLPAINAPAAAPDNSANEQLQISARLSRGRLRRVLARARKLQQRLAELEIRRTQMEQASAQWAQRLMQLESERDAFPGQQAAWSLEHAAACEQLSRRELENEAAEIRLRRQSDDLALQVSRLEARASDLDQVIAGERAALVTERQELEMRLLELETARAIWRAEQEQQQTSLTAAQGAHDLLRQQLEHQQQTIAEGRTALQQQQEETSQKTRVQQEELQRQRAELENLQTELERSTRGIELRRKELDAERLRLEARRSAGDHEQNRRQTLVVDRELALDEAERRLLTRLAVLDGLATDLKRRGLEQAKSFTNERNELWRQRCELEDRERESTQTRRAWKLEKTSQQKGLAEQARELDTRQQQLDQARQALDQQAAQLEANRRELADLHAELQQRSGVLEMQAAEHAADWQQQQVELDALQQQITAAESNLNERETAWQLDVANRERSLQEQSDRLASMELEVRAAEELHQTRTRELSEREESLLRDLSQFEENLTAEKAKFDEEKVALQKQRDAFHAERLSWEEVQATARARLTEKSQKVDRRLAETAERQQALEAEHLAWVTEQEQIRAALAAEQAELASTRSGLEQLQLSLQADREAQAAREAEVAAAPQWTPEQSAALADLDAMRGTLANDQAQLIAERDYLSRERHALLVERETLQAEQQRLLTAQATADLVPREPSPSAQETELLAQVADLEQQLANMNQQQLDLECRRAELESGFLSREEQLATARQAMEARQSEVEAERDDWQSALESEREQLLHQQTELATQAEQLAARERDLQQRQQDLDEQATRLADQARELAEQAATSASSEPDWTPIGQRSAAELLAEQEASAAEALAEEADLQERRAQEERQQDELAHEERRRGWLAALEQADVQDNTPEQTAIAEQRPSIAPSLAEPAEPAEEDHAASISAYMSRLLDRAGGRQATNSHASQATPTAQPIGKVPPVDAPLEVEQLAPIERVVRPLPASLVDMSSMRELANMNSRLAIDKAFRKGVVRTCNSKAIVLVVSLLIGLILLYWGLEGVSYALVGGVASLIISAIWGVQYIVLARQLFGPGSEQWENEEVEHEEQPETDVLETSND